MDGPFQLKDCALIAIATGRRAQNLKELRDRLEDIHPGSIFYHFWGGLLYQRFDDPEYQNDFASWAYHGLHDLRLAERLGIIDPSEFRDMEDLRRELIDEIEERLDESEIVPWAKSDQQFYFTRSKIIVFDTGIRIEEPRTLRELIPKVPVSTIFYHFIDARRRTPKGKDDFSEWLSQFGEPYQTVVQRIGEIDPYFASLAELRSQLAAACEKHLP